MRLSLCLTVLFAAIFQSGIAQNCEINNLIVEDRPCVNGMFLVDLDFDITNPAGEVFGVVGNATNYGFFPYDSLPITLGPLEGDGSTEWEFIVYDLDGPTCQSTFELGVVTCCEILNIAVDPLQCNDTETFDAVVNFNFTNTGNVGFNVFDLDDNQLGSFLYSDLPVTVENIPSSGTGDDGLIFCDLGDPNCCTLFEFAGPDCDPTDCEIFDIGIEATECRNGRFNVLLSFQTENVSNLFTVQGNGIDYGEFSYDSLPVEIGPFEGDGEAVYELLVVDSESDGLDCSDVITFDALDCPEACGFRDVAIEPTDCIGDSAYSLDLNFIPVSTGDQGFTVFGDSEALGSFDYGELPVSVDFPASGDFFDTLIICDNVDTMCCDTIQFQALLCNECLIFNMVAETTECDTNDQFNVIIDFQFQNVGAEGFQVGGNGMIYGQFDYAELPITLGPFLGDDITFWEFVVFDIENALCIQGVEVGVINCVNPCEIGPLDAQFIECSGDGVYDLLLDFDFANVDSVGFDVFAGDELIGFFSYDSLPVRVEDFPSSGMPMDTITVCENDDPECCSTLIFPSPGCFEICTISDIIVAPITCTSDSTFEALVTFSFEDLSGDFVEISSSGDLLGTFHVDSLPVLIEDFPSSVFDTEITICDRDDPDCCETTTFQSLSCNTDCNFEIEETVLPCQDDGTYAVSFSWSGVEADDVDSLPVFVDGDYYGSFPNDSLPTVSGIVGDGEDVTFTICVNDEIDCCDELTIEAPLCPVDTCEISDLTFSEITCTDDGTYSGLLGFSSEGLASSFVRVSADGELIDVFAVDSFPLILGGFIGDSSQSEIVICDNGNPDCCDTLMYTAPSCEIVCDILDIAAQELECQGDGTFAMSIDFTVQGFEGDSVDLGIDGVAIGTFPADSSIVVTGLEGNGSESVIQLCETGNTECCSELIFERPMCEGCTVSEVVLLSTECTTDSTFGAFIAYSSLGVDTNGISVYADGEFLGMFPAISPIFVGNLPGGDGMLDVQLCGNESVPEPCCSNIGIDQLECLGFSCPIADISTTVLECDSMGMFAVSLDMSFIGTPGGGGFIVAGNGSTYGSFSYSDLPVEIGPLPGDGITEWEFLAIDLGEPSCSAFSQVGTVMCKTSALFNATKAQKLQVRYYDGNPFFEVPANDLELTLWTTTGQLLYSGAAGAEGSLVEIGALTEYDGLLVVSLRNANGLFTARAFKQ